MKYYRRNVGDYAASTRHLSLLEHGAYTMFLDLYYATERALPREVDKALRAIGARSADEREAAEAVLREFFTETEDGWAHQTCEKVIGKYRVMAETARKNGANGGRPPVTDGNREITEIGYDSVPNQKAIHNPETNSKNIGGLSSPRPKSRATQLPADWTPSNSHHALAAELGVTIAREAAQFQDHHRAKGSAFKDWDAAFRTWIRNAAKFAQAKAAQPAAKWL